MEFDSTTKRKLSQIYDIDSQVLISVFAGLLSFAGTTLYTTNKNNNYVEECNQLMIENKELLKKL